MNDDSLTFSLEDVGCGLVTAPEEFWNDLRQSLTQLVQQLNRVANEVQNMLPGFPRPARIDTWLGNLAGLTAMLVGGRSVQSRNAPGATVVPVVPWSGDPKSLPPALLKLAVRLKLGELHSHDEVLRQKTHATEFVERVRQRIVDLSSILQWDAIERADVLRLPVVTEFVTLAAAYERSPPEDVPTIRYDDKFGILRSPACFAADFAWVRDQSTIRGRPFSVAYADIDRFKSLNTELTEAVVDREVLPAFMRALEGYCFHRAMAYREGGDEYMLLIPNHGPQETAAFLKGLQRELANVAYAELVPRRPTVSVGFHVLEPDDPETTFQAKALANKAKNRAKKRRGSVRETTREEREEILSLVGHAGGKSPIQLRVQVEV